ncbi:hypothetical protein GGI21_005307, partial [Coemansia aciculifera]
MRLIVRRYSDFAAQVRRIVHPPEHAQIEQTKEVAQQARLQGADIGERLRAAADLRRKQALEQLEKVQQASISASDVAGLGAVLEGFQTLGSASHCVRILQEMRKAGHHATAAQLNSTKDVASRSQSVAALAG